MSRRRRPVCRDRRDVTYIVGDVTDKFLGSRYLSTPYSRHRRAFRSWLFSSCQVSWVSLPFNPHTRVTDELFGHDYSRHVHPMPYTRVTDELFGHDYSRHAYVHPMAPWYAYSRHRRAFRSWFFSSCASSRHRQNLGRCWCYVGSPIKLSAPSDLRVTKTNNSFKGGGFHANYFWEILITNWLHLAIFWTFSIWSSVLFNTCVSVWGGGYSFCGDTTHQGLLLIRVSLVISSPHSSPCWSRNSLYMYESHPRAFHLACFSHTFPNSR